jgi:3alpha(or 20beta)-hydroxysteroid dehydrogenase
MRRVVVVTGAARGMGQAHCLELARLGYHVCATDVLPLEETVAMASANGGAASGHALDVGSEDSWKSLLDEDIGKFGRPYGLINNAGIVSRLGVAQETEAGWDKVIAVNLTGPFLGMKLLAPLFRDGGGGSIVNIASSAALAGYRGGAYTAAKWGLRGLTKTAAGEFAPWGVRVNAVHPGLIDTPLARGDDAFTNSHMRSVPIGRIGQGSDIAKAAAFLLSDEAAYITGTDLSVDGGFMAAGLYGRITKDRDLYVTT